MKVLWLTPDKPDNISVGRQRIASRLRHSGHEVVVRGTTPETAYRSLRERGQYDVVVGVTRSGAFAGVAVAAVHRIPLVVDHIDPIRQFTETGQQWFTPFVRAAEDVAFRVAEHVLYVYDEEVDRVQRHSDSATKTALGVDYDRIANPSEDGWARVDRMLADYDLQSKVAVYVGGLEPLYNVEPMLASVELLDDWSLVIAGAGSLEETVRQRSDGEQIVFLGTINHELVPGLLHVADVGISLVDDPHTLKVLEYGAAGLPVVQLRGRAESRFGDSVTYCGPKVSDIATAIERASSNDSSELRSFARQFDWSEIAAQYERALRVVCGQSTALTIDND